jgi:predicted GIY-YIG superfamily endonuclease
MSKQYVYIVQSAKENTKCKIGVTNDLERRLKDYNSTTGKSKENISIYLFTCEVSDMKQVENDIKAEFNHLREEKSREIYFYNKNLFEKYVNFIKSHKKFIEEIFIKIDVQKEVVKIVKRTTPTLKERGLSPKDVMQKAKNVGFDEFYTRYEDVEKEINMYDAEIWKDKTVFCNCDDAIGDTEDKNNINTSAFSLYFIKNFEKLGLKKLICTHFAGVVDLFNQGPKGYIYTYIYTKTRTEEFKDFPKNYTGSFDDPLSLKILNEEADIVCTNPPFSRAIEYWNILIKSGKKFLIISNITNILYKDYIPYFKENKVWA